MSKRSWAFSKAHKLRKRRFEMLEVRAMLSGSTTAGFVSQSAGSVGGSTETVLVANHVSVQPVIAEPDDGAFQASDAAASNDTALIADVNGDGREDVVHFVDGNWQVVRTESGGPQCQTPHIETVGVAVLPVECVDTSISPPERQTPISVPANGDLQQAIDQAQPGDIIELEAGATYRGRFTFGPKVGDEWIHIRSSRHAELPQSGVRIDPGKHAHLMPKILASGAGADGRAIDILAGAHHYRFEGIEVTSDHQRTDVEATNLVVLNAFGLNDPADLPHHIIFDRMYLHGNPVGNILNAIRLDGRHVAVVDSYVSDFHAIGRESHGLYAADAAGPIKIVNNHVAAAGTPILFGGDDPHIPNLINQDIEIRGNLLTKDEAWRDAPAGHKFSLEFKNARRVLVSENIIENAWADNRYSDGSAIIIKSTNQEGGCTWCVTEDITVSHNILRDVAIGVKISARVYNGVTDRAERILIENNLFYDMDQNQPGGGAGIAFVLLEDYDDIYLVHNTTVSDGVAAITLGSNISPPLDGLNLVVRDNLISHNTYGIKGNGTGSGQASLDEWVEQYSFTGNVLFGNPDVNPDILPAGNELVDEVAFLNRAEKDFSLPESSPWKNQGSDGADVGVNVELLERTACAETGICGAFDTEQWGSWSNGVVWNDIQAADVDGDGLDDVIGRANGHWWVARSMGNRFLNEHWGRWSDKAAWTDVHVADVDGNGLDDVVGRNGNDWWASISNGTSFYNFRWSEWPEAQAWDNVQIADVDGNGTDDILGQTNGQWWVSRATNGDVITEPWASWSDKVTWTDVQIADLDGNGKDDILGRADGHWWAAVSQGDHAINQHWGKWSDATNWKQVTVGDMNGDGISDVAGREHGRWWVAISNGANFETTYWGNWAKTLTIDHVHAADVNGDGKDDLTGLINGKWWEAAISGENAFVS